MQQFSYHLRAANEIILRQISDSEPEIVKASREMDFSAETSKHIGIAYQPPTAGMAHIKCYFEDFIVEEIIETDEICTIAPPEPYRAIPYDAETQKIEATIIKKGMNGFELSERLAEALDIPLKYVTFGGLKDGRGITSQRYSFNNTPPERLVAISIPNTVIKDIHARTGMRTVGELRGNRFTITLRAHPQLNPYAFHARLQHIEKHGFYNFFSLQRFGSRLMSHNLGKLILQQNYEETVRKFLTETTEFETKLLARHRQAAAKHWGNWAAMRKEFSVLSYFFQNEIVILSALEQNPADVAAALGSIPQQVKMWVAAFESFAFNLLLSSFAKRGEVPEILPLLHPDHAIRSLYAEVFDIELLKTFNWYHPKLLFLGGARKREVATISFPIVHAVEKIPEGYILRFELGKGAYATNFLSNLVELSQGRFAPTWVQTAPVDATAQFDSYPLSTTLAALSPRDDAVQSLDNPD